MMQSNSVVKALNRWMFCPEPFCTGVNRVPHSFILILERGQDSLLDRFKNQFSQSFYGFS